MDEQQIYKNLGLKIKFYRENARLTQEKLAENCGISLDYLGKIEVCINKPELKTLIKISNALNIPLHELFK